MRTENMTFEQVVEWAGGYLAVELFKGNFKSAVWTVCHVVCQWKDQHVVKT